MANNRLEAVAALQVRLGWRFRDPAVLERALTHASVGEGAKTDDNERLEFLGDRVLGLVVAERLVARDPKASEGDMAPRLNLMVSRATCARVARRIGLGPALRMSGAETKTGGRDKESILAGACEAVIAAVYQEGRTGRGARPDRDPVERGTSTVRTPLAPRTSRPGCRNGRKGEVVPCPPIRWSPAPGPNTRPSSRSRSASRAWRRPAAKAPPPGGGEGGGGRRISPHFSTENGTALPHTAYFPSTVRMAH